MNFLCKPKEAVRHCEECNDETIQKKICGLPQSHSLLRNDKSIISLSLRRGAKGEVIKNSKNDVPSSQAPSPQRRRVKNAAFTLAEVLITLSILGVVAAILIPNVVQHYKKNFVETRLRQAYSIIDNVLEMAKIQNGTNFETMFNPVGSNYYQMEFADKFIIPYLNIQKDCGCEKCGMPKICKYTKSDNLIKNGYNENYNSSYFYGLNGRIIYTQYGSTRYLQLKNGMYLYVLGSGAAGSFIFDINGQKGPNKYGYDIFAFTMFRPMSGAEANCKASGYNNRYCNKGNELLPGPYNSNSYGLYNEKNDPNRLDCSENGDGRWCSGLIMYNNWKVPKDYPIKF